MDKNIKDKNILVMGYAMTGKAVVEFLLRKGANVTITDRGDLSKDPSVTSFLQEGIKVVDGGHPLELLDEKFDFIVKNPGIPYQVPFLQEAIKRQIPIFTDVELAYWYSLAPIIGITGSNGKTTTTSLIQKFLTHRNAGKSLLAGNIGVPSLKVISQANENDDVVMELSSFQLMGVDSFKPNIAVICNIYEAHIDYHGSREGYVQAKLNLIKNLTKRDYLVYNANLLELSELVKNSPATLIPFSINMNDLTMKQKGAYVENGEFFFREESIAKVSDLRIPGQHNIENALAAIAVAKIKGITNRDIINTLHDYNGMPHRNQLIADFKGRKFYNDSKATNMIATNTALESFINESIVYIGGGLDRGNEFDDLVPNLGPVKVAYLYGETKEKMKRAFIKAGVKEIELKETLYEAVNCAYDKAQQGDIILFSPACASWDQFKSFEVRGDEFVSAVKKLIQEKPYQ